jgi:glycosidase
MRPFLYLLFSFFFFQNSLSAQIIWTTPAFPTDNEPVTVFFDATQGTGGLAGCNCDVYLHTGLITSNSTSNSDWKYVFTTWGQANSAWKMTPVPGSPDVYSYDIQPTIRARYNVTNPNEEILKLAFVFRNANGSLEGKGVGGTDIFYDVYPANADLSVVLQSPASPSIFVELGEMIEVKGVSSQSADLSLFDNGSLIASATGTELNHTITVTTGGTHLVEFVADNGTQQVSQTFTYVVPGATVVEALPPGVDLGINYLSDTEVLFALYAPGKQNVYLIGDFNNWQFSNDFQLKRTTDGTTWWIEIGGLMPGEYYAFQYVVDGTIRTGDPYSNLILDPANDGFISATTFPNMPPYPTGKTTGIVSLIQPGAPDYPWQVTNFERPEQGNLVVYELLMRDFLKTQTYQTLLDTLDYFQRLGVTAIEFMPINEFDGNLSWGYNPTYHYALDKYHGTPDAFKAVVDACHERGIAVIVDVVFNHAHEKNPLCMLYWDDANFRPAANNPWLNQQPTHDFNVFFDFNHESQATRTYVIKTLQHWLNEYKVDGFRFDLSKGFTQKVTIGNVGAWGQYDANRIATLKIYADAIWNASPNAYVILEHFADNAEEKELANYGMMLWAGGVHDQYKEASMGYASNFTGASYKSRGWDDPNLMVYMESHDEERMMYKNLQFGNSSGSYNVKNLSTALDRVEMASAFFYTIPGPKMLWQFGELGYDYSINWCTNGTVNSNCRLDPKPVRWDYTANPDRLDIYNTIRSLLYLRNNYDVFQTTDFQLNVSGFQKTIHLNDDEMDVAVLGNFGVQSASVTPNFQHTGWWYEYFTGDSLNVTNVSAAIDFQPGEYRLYTDVRIEKPAKYTDSKEAGHKPFDWTLSPNPSDGEFRVSFDLETRSRVQLNILDMQGRQVISPVDELKIPGRQVVTWSAGLEPGVYLVSLRVNGVQETRKLVVLKK